ARHRPENGAAPLARAEGQAEGRRLDGRVDPRPGGGRSGGGCGNRARRGFAGSEGSASVPRLHGSRNRVGTAGGAGGNGRGRGSGSADEGGAEAAGSPVTFRGRRRLSMPDGRRRGKREGIELWKSASCPPASWWTKMKRNTA